MSASTRVVFDCNTFVQAFASPRGPAGRCVQLAFDGAVVLFVSPVVLREVQDVMTRPTVIQKLRLRPERIETFLEAIEGVATVLDSVPDRFSYDRDPDDAHYVNLALAADARLIVSRDRDLLDLMDLTSPDGASFRTRFPSLRILNPVAFLQEIEAVS